MRVLSSSGRPAPFEETLRRLRHHCWEALAVLAVGWFFIAAFLGVRKIDSLTRCHFISETRLQPQRSVK